MSLRNILSERVSQAMQAAGIPAECQPHVAPSKNSNFGDYQANGAMGAAKAMKSNPRAIAQSIVEHLSIGIVQFDTQRVVFPKLAAE